MWKSHLPAEAFTLLQGRDQLSHYRFGAGSIDHTFCKHCGVYACVYASFPELGGDIVCVNVACLDDASDEEWSAAPIRFEDGANDDWNNAPRVTAHL